MDNIDCQLQFIVCVLLKNSFPIVSSKCEVTFVHPVNTNSLTGYQINKQTHTLCRNAPLKYWLTLGVHMSCFRVAVCHFKDRCSVTWNKKRADSVLMCRNICPKGRFSLGETYKSLSWQTWKWEPYPGHNSTTNCHWSGTSDGKKKVKYSGSVFK